MEHNKEEASISSDDKYFRKAVKTDLDSKNISNTPNTKKTARFVVVYIWSTNSPPVTSKNTLLGLSMIKIQEDGGFAQQNNQRMQNETEGIKAVNQSAEMQKMLKIKTVQLSLRRDQENSRQDKWKRNTREVQHETYPLPTIVLLIRSFQAMANPGCTRRLV